MVDPTRCTFVICEPEKKRLIDSFASTVFSLAENQTLSPSKSKKGNQD